MADLIDRKELRDALYEADAITMQGVKIINQFPAVDAVEVVRCRDCVKGYIDLTFRDDKTWCVKFGKDMDLDGFCSYGERKDGDGNG